MPARRRSRPSFLTQKIVGEVDGASWVEIVHDTYQGDQFGANINFQLGQGDLVF